MKLGKTKRNGRLADETQKTEELIKCVSELDIDEETKCSVIESIRKGQTTKGIRLLRQYRGENTKRFTQRPKQTVSD